MGWVIGGLIAAIVGAGMQQYAAQEANRQAQAVMQEGYQSLRQSQDKINQRIADATTQYESGTREANQQAEAERIANDIKSDVSESQVIRDAQQETAGNVSNDYQRAREASQAKTEQEMNAFADLIGKIRSAGTLRMNEGFRTARAAQDIEGLARNAQGNMVVAQDEAEQALHSKDGLANLGQLVSAIGSVMSIGGGLASSGAQAAAQTGATTAANAGVDAVSGAAFSPSLFQKATSLWGNLSPAVKIGAVGAGKAIASNPWRN